MQDVARLAGVGLMTVSRALNKSAPVSEEVQRRVEEAVALLGYRPNEAARSLRQGRSRTIGLIVPNFYDPFYAVCSHAITLVANEHDYSVMVTTSDNDPEKEYRVASSMLLRHVEGILVIPSVGGATKLSRDEFKSTPIVTLDQPLVADTISSTGEYVSLAYRRRLLLTRCVSKATGRQCGKLTWSPKLTSTASRERMPMPSCGR